MAEINLNGDLEVNDEVFSRFLGRYLIGDKDECWPWLSRMHTEDGYGRFMVNNIDYFAHRVSYFYYHGMIKSDFLVLHIQDCPNKHCVNPYHLYLGTHDDNMKDRSIVNPESYNNFKTNNPNIKLTQNEVNEIREKHLFKCYKAHELARQYHVTEHCIHAILQHRIWK